MVDPRIERTHRDLSNALLIMLRTKNITDISVKDLCEKAHINRSTFYDHFGNIREILDELENEFLSEFNIYRSIWNDSDRLQLVMTARYENELMQILLKNTDLEKYLYSNTFNQLKLRYHSDTDENIISITANYLVSGTLAVLTNCINNITSIPDEEIASLINRLNLQSLMLLDSQPCLQKLVI